MSHRYILGGHNPVPCPDLMEWARWFETADRRVARDVIGDVTVSTVFLGLDHSFGRGRPTLMDDRIVLLPLLFETMIFGGEHDQYQARAYTWVEAEREHLNAAKLVRGDAP